MKSQPFRAKEFGSGSWNSFFCVCLDVAFMWYIMVSFPLGETKEIGKNLWFHLFLGWVFLCCMEPLNTCSVWAPWKESVNFSKQCPPAQPPLSFPVMRCVSQCLSFRRAFTEQVPGQQAAWLVGTQTTGSWQDAHQHWLLDYALPAVMVNGCGYYILLDVTSILTASFQSTVQQHLIGKSIFPPQQRVPNSSMVAKLTWPCCWSVCGSWALTGSLSWRRQWMLQHSAQLRKLWTLGCG